MASLHKVCVYIFDTDDSRSAQQRLEASVADFCDICNLSLPQPEELVTARTERGKPYFPHASHLQFSISHSGTYWACALSDQTLGLDLQERERPKNQTPEELLARHQKLANRFFHPVEAEFVSQPCRHNFLTVWTAREAYVKHTGQGIDKHFSEHCVVPEDASEQIPISGNSGSIRWSAMGKTFWKTPYAGDYTLCVCTESPCEYVIVTPNKM